MLIDFCASIGEARLKIVKRLALVCPKARATRRQKKHTQTVSGMSQPTNTSTMMIMVLLVTMTRMMMKMMIGEIEMKIVVGPL